jgi:hypothetical protein
MKELDRIRIRDLLGRVTESRQRLGELAGLQMMRHELGDLDSFCEQIARWAGY